MIIRERPGRAEGRREGARAGPLDTLAAYVEKQWGPDIADDFRVHLSDRPRDLPTLTDLMGRWERGEAPLDDEDTPGGG